MIEDIVYLILLLLVYLRIIDDTGNTSKTLVYLLLVIFLPVIGILFYFSFGINYLKQEGDANPLENGLENQKYCQ